MWNDINQDGIQDDGELGIGGVAVSLLDADEVVIATTTTSARGAYQFTGLPSGTYLLQFTLPDGFAWSAPHQGDNIRADSDIDASTGRSGPVTLGAGQANLTIDAGVHDASAGPPTPTPGGFIDVALNQINENLYTCSNGTIRMSVRNMGTGTRDATVGPISIADTLPDAFTFLTFNGDGWTCSAVGQSITCTYAETLAPNAEIFVDLTVLVGEDAYPTINNIAIVSTLYDGNPHNNLQDKPYTVYHGSGSCAPSNATPTLTSSPIGAPTQTPGGPPNTPGAGATPTITPGGAPSNLSLAMNHIGAFTAGANGIYTLTVANVGAGTTSAIISVTDPLPTGLTYVSGVGSGWICSATGQTVSCSNPGPLAPGASSNLTLTVAVGSAAIPTITNTAQVATFGDTIAGDNSASDPTTVRVDGPVPTSTPTASPTPSRTPPGGGGKTTPGAGGPGRRAHGDARWVHRCGAEPNEREPLHLQYRYDPHVDPQHGDRHPRRHGGPNHYYRHAAGRICLRRVRRRGLDLLDGRSGLYLQVSSDSRSGRRDFRQCYRLCE